MGKGYTEQETKMEREIGRWNKATGIKKYVAGQVQGVDEPVELWVGDVIECRVYITDRAGCYIRITGKVLWDVAYGMYIIHGHFVEADGSYSNFFPLHKIVNENIKFITKIPRTFGSQRDIIFHIVSLLRESANAPVDVGPAVDGMNTSELATTHFAVGDVQSIADTVTYDMLDSLIEEIGKMGVIPSEEITKAFAGD